MIVHNVTVTINAENSMEAAQAEKSLKWLADKLGASKINKLMKKYESNKLAVDLFIKTL